jgi:hypothetical protein
MAKRKYGLSPKYVVNMNIKALDIPKAGVALILKVRDRRGGLVGTAEIGQGSFGWRPSNKQEFKRISWGKLGARLNV